MNDEKTKKITIKQKKIVWILINVGLFICLVLEIYLYVYEMNNPLPAFAPHDIDYVILRTVGTTTVVNCYLLIFGGEIIYLYIYLGKKRCQKCDNLNREEALYCDKCGIKIEKV